MEAALSTSNVVTPLGDAPNSPELDVNLNAHVPALRDIGQAVQLVRSLQAENREREKKNARIMDRYNSERPYNAARLRSDGLSWKTNITTKPLSTLVDKVVPRFTKAVGNMKYLTASKLPDRFPDAAKKTETFQKEITNACRGHEQWDELLDDITQENTLFGYTAAGWLDTSSWFPRFYNQDAFLVPQGTKHNAKSAPVVCFRDSYLVHELFNMIREKEAASYAGWDIDNVVESLNDAVPNDLRSVETDYGRIYADLARSSAILSSFTGAKTVIVWHVFVAEVDGHITHVAFDDRNGKQLFWKTKQFDRMSDTASFYSFQRGNGMLQGSKGIGRELYNMAAVLDRSRNEAVDRLQLSGKVLLQCDEKDIKRFRMSVVGNAILIASGYKVQQANIDGNFKPFLELDQFFTALLDEIAGNSTPKQRPAERVTKAEVELDAASKEETKDTVISRFLRHFSRMMSTIQRRLCDPQTADQDAKELQAKLLVVMSPEELAYLANQPAVEAIADYSDLERQIIAMVAQEGRGNPLYNQYELERRSLTAKVGADFADAVLLAQNDPTEAAENQRQQQLEMLAINSGQTVPISPRDNHLVHLSVLHDAIAPMISQAAGNMPVWLRMQAITKHAIPHIQAAEQSSQKDKVQQFKQFFAKVISTLQHLHSTAPADPNAAPGPTGAPGTAAPAAVPMTPIHEQLAIAYKDLPEDVKRQVEAKLGLTPSQMAPASPNTAPAAPYSPPEPPATS